MQQPDGHWVGELEGDTILESEYLLLLQFMGWTDPVRFRRAANYVRARQLPTGGWALYPGGPPEVGASVKAYFALKLAGVDRREPDMLRACQVIRSLGGPARANTFTKIYLALFGQYPWRGTPAIPPEPAPSICFTAPDAGMRRHGSGWAASASAASSAI